MNASLDHAIRDQSRFLGGKAAPAHNRPNVSAPSPSKMNRAALPSPTGVGGASLHNRRSPTNSDDSASSAGRRNAFVAKYGADARNALERIRRATNEDPFVAAHGRVGGSSSARLSTNTRTSLGLQLNGNRVTGVVRGSPAFLVQRFHPGDEILAVDGLEVAPHDVAKAMVGSDKPGSSVRLSVRSSVSRRIEEVEVPREDVEVVKMHRAVFEGLDQLADTAPDPAVRGQVEALIASLTNAQARSHEHQTQVRAVVAGQQEAARQAVDEVYASVGKLEGAYSGVQARSHRLTEEIDRVTRELLEAKGHPVRPPDVGPSPDMNPEQGREVAMLQAKMESLLSEVSVLRRQRDELHEFSLRAQPLPAGGGEDSLYQRLAALEDENKKLLLALERRSADPLHGGDIQESMERVELLGRSRQGLAHYTKFHGEPHAAYGEGFDPREEDFHQREPQGGLGSGFFALDVDPDPRAPPGDGARLDGEQRIRGAYVLPEQAPLPSIVDEMAM